MLYTLKSPVIKVIVVVLHTTLFYVRYFNVLNIFSFGTKMYFGNNGQFLKIFFGRNKKNDYFTKSAFYLSILFGK